jgi:sugar lactone lactonase YvrE
LKKLLLFLLLLAIVAVVILRVRYGAGSPYPDLSTAPALGDVSLELVLEYPEPVGNVAVSAEGRVFFTVHPESRPQGNKLLEWVDGAAEPYPSGGAQPTLFDTVLGMVIDRQGRLWTIDHGNHGFRTARLIAIDLATGSVLHNHEFREDMAPAGSMLQDLQVSADGRHVFIADASIWRKKPALVVYDAETQAARRLLEAHPSVSAEDYLIRTKSRDMSYLGGLVSLKSGVDGIALDAENQWLYYGAINQSGLYRLPVRALLDTALSERQLAAYVERYADKPLSDGLSADTAGNVYVTDVEHGAVLAIDPERGLRTLIKSPRIRWADALSFGPDGWLYVADSAIPELVLQTSEHIRQQGPYRIFRFKPGFAGIPGH